MVSELFHFYNYAIKYSTGLAFGKYYIKEAQLYKIWKINIKSFVLYAGVSFITLTTMLRVIYIICMFPGHRKKMTQQNMLKALG